LANQKVRETAHQFLILFDQSIHQSPAQSVKIASKPLQLLGWLRSTWLTMWKVERCKIWDENHFADAWYNKKWNIHEKL